MVHAQTSFDITEEGGNACTIMANELESLVTRLEKVTTRLETLVPGSGSLQALLSTSGITLEEEEDEYNRPSSPLPPPQLSSPSSSASTSTASTTALPAPTANSPLRECLT